MFTGEATRQQREETARAREQQELALAKNREIAQNQEAEADVASGEARRLPRGRRLLLAASTGDKLGA